MSNDLKSRYIGEKKIYKVRWSLVIKNKLQNLKLDPKVDRKPMD